MLHCHLCGHCTTSNERRCTIHLHNHWNQCDKMQPISKTIATSWNKMRTVFECQVGFWCASFFSKHTATKTNQMIQRGCTIAPPKNSFTTGHATALCWPAPGLERDVSIGEFSASSDPNVVLLSTCHRTLLSIEGMCHLRLSTSSNTLDCQCDSGTNKHVFEAVLSVTDRRERHGENSSNCPTPG